MSQKYNEKSDIYSIGVLLYSLLSGDFPYDVNSIEQLKYQT